MTQHPRPLAALGSPVLVAGIVLSATTAQHVDAGRNAPASAIASARQSAERQLTSVSAVSPRQAWAVGSVYRDHVTRTLILHWNGSTWTRVPSPNPTPNYDGFTAVSAISAGEGWAVGYTYRQGPLVAHWTAGHWTRVAVTGMDQWDTLNSVSTESATDAWAVGYRYVSGSSTVPIIWHWDGVSWNKAASPNGHMPDTELTKVSATSATNAWAVGTTSNPNVNPYGDNYPARAFVLHWNGTTWSRVSVPSPRPFRTHIRAVSASSARNAWAIGAYYGKKQHQLLLRWNGTSWSQVPGPKLSALWLLRDITAVAKRDAWATGEWYPHGGSARKTLTLHWNGIRWTKVASPSPPPDPRPWSIDADAADDAWVVGWHGLRVLTMHWNGRRWTNVPG
jgi:hypothetical protein